MEPTDRTSNVPPQASPERAFAPDDAQAVREAAGFHRQLEAQPAEAVRSGRAPRRNAMLPNPGGPTDSFAEAGAMVATRSAPPADDSQGQEIMMDVIVSVRNRSIGSVYLPFGRVRTTHHAGPGVSVMSPDRILRFNIDQAEAIAAFQHVRQHVLAEVLATRDPTLPLEQQRMAAADAFLRVRDAWIAALLLESDPLPGWAHPLTGPHSVGHISEVQPESGRVLFAIYDRGPTHPPHTHISRGEMARMPMSQQTLTAIGRALDLVECVHNPARRNELFYDYLGSYAPDFADLIRRP